MDRYRGHGGSHYDSQAEAKASHRFAELGFKRNDSKFSQVFQDGQGTEFYARPDFHHADYDIYLEFKASTLNSLKTKAGSDKRLDSMADYRGGIPLRSDYLSYGWNHSKHKQAIVQAALTPDKLIICFQDAHTPTYAEALGYSKTGLWFCTMATLPTYMAALRLRQHGLQVGFSHNYSLEDADGIVLPASISYS